MRLSNLVTWFVFVSVVHGHSWITCSDYLEKNGAINEHIKCRGWPRGANLRVSRTSKFGVSKGFDHVPTEDTPCQLPRDDASNYDADHPKAVYYPGQQVVLTHPMKSHSSDNNCLSENGMDTGSFIYRSEMNPTKDPTLSEFRKRLLFDLSRSALPKSDPKSSIYPKFGFQNAPKFCENPDGALGTYSFNIPVDLKEGLYTFMWVWAFKNDGDLYSTCFEVTIAKNKEQRNGQLKNLAITNLTAPCGGSTSNPTVMGSESWCSSAGMIRINFILILFVLTLTVATLF